MEAECSCLGSEFQTAGAAPEDSVDLAESGSEERTCHVSARPEMLATATDVVEAGRTGSVDRVKGVDSHLEQ